MKKFLWTVWFLVVLWGVGIFVMLGVSMARDVSWIESSEENGRLVVLMLDHAPLGVRVQLWAEGSQRTLSVDQLKKIIAEEPDDPAKKEKKR